MINTNQQINHGQLTCYRLVQESHVLDGFDRANMRAAQVITMVHQCAELTGRSALTWDRSFGFLSVQHK